MAMEGMNFDAVLEKRVREALIGVLAPLYVVSPRLCPPSSERIGKVIDERAGRLFACKAALADCLKWQWRG
jgi:hypothetical protein